MTTRWDILTEAFDRSEYLNSAGAGNLQFLDKLMNSTDFLQDYGTDELTLIYLGALAGMTGADAQDLYELAEQLAQEDNRS